MSTCTFFLSQAKSDFQLKTGPTVVRLLTLAVAFLGIQQGVWLLEANKESRIANELAQLGGRVHFAWRLDDRFTVLFNASTGSAPQWMVPGDGTIVYVHLLPSHEKSLDDRLACLKSLRNLRCLKCDGAPITDATLQHIAGHASLVQLDLWSTPVTDEGVRHLTSCPRLNHLNLDHTRVTDASVPYFTEMAHLRWLQLRGTRVTADGVAQLRRQMPGVRIDSDFDPGSLFNPRDPAYCLAAEEATPQPKHAKPIDFLCPELLVSRE